MRKEKKPPKITVSDVGLAGFGGGIGSGRSSGYGRYHIDKKWKEDQK